MVQKIYLIPIGDIDRANLEKLVTPLQKKFGYQAIIGENLGEITFAYYQKRDQFYSTPILDKIRKSIPKDAFKALGIADKDLFVPSLNFVFGEADLDGPVAVISLTRLRQEFYGLEKDDLLFEMRLLKEAIHELGHCFGLRHCSNTECVMHFSNSLQDTDIKSTDFCPSCDKKLKR